MPFLHEAFSVSTTLTHLIYLSDLLMSRFVVGQELERLNTDRLAQRLERLSISPSHLPVIVDLIPKGVFGAASSF